MFTTTVSYTRPSIDVPWLVPTIAVIKLLNEYIADGRIITAINNFSADDKTLSRRTEWKNKETTEAFKLEPLFSDLLAARRAFLSVPGTSYNVSKVWTSTPGDEIQPAP